MCIQNLNLNLGVCTTQSLNLEKLEVHLTIGRKVPGTYSFFHLNRGWWSMSCPSCFTQGKETQYSLYKRLGGPKGLSGQLQKILPSPAFNLLTIQSIAGCTDGAVPCISLMCCKIWNCNITPLICLIIVEKMTLLYVISLYQTWVVPALLLDLCTLAVTCPLSKWFILQCCNGIWHYILGKLDK